MAVFHLTHPVDAQIETDDARLAQRITDEAAAIGIHGFDAQGARVERLPVWQPQWGPVAHSWIRTVLMQWSEMGIMAVGRGGAMAALDPGEEIGLAMHLAQAGLEGQLEVHRLHTHPPVEPLDLEAVVAICCAVTIEPVECGTELNIAFSDCYTIPVGSRREVAIIKTDVKVTQNVILFVELGHIQFPARCFVDG